MRPAESFVSQPVRSLQTMLRVLAEDDPRLPTVVLTGSTDHLPCRLYPLFNGNTDFP